MLEALKSRWLTGGPRVNQFEKMFADYIGVRYAIAVNSCTAALHLTMRAIDIKPGDEVIVPVFTFAATANAPIFCRAKPLFADIDEKTFNISPDDISERITQKTRAIIVVHYAGQPCDMKEITEIAKDHSLFLIEDCAHSLGSEYRERKTGSLGIAGCFSFYPTKIITTLEGGMVTTNDERLAHRLKILRDHGITRTAFEREKSVKWRYDVVDLGYNYRLNEVQAALGISQLRRVEEGIKRRVKAANYYTGKLDSDWIVTPYEAPNRSHVYHLYVIKIREYKGITRDKLYAKLLNNGIGASVHYTPLHLLSFYRKSLSIELDRFPVAEKVFEQVLSLPLFPTLTKKKIDHIVENVVTLL